MRYYVDFIDKDHGDYIIKCVCEKHDGKFWQTLMITSEIYKWFVNAKINDKANYKQKQKNQIIIIYLTKLSKNGKLILRAEFGDNVVDIDEIRFKKRAKVYRYQLAVDIKVFDGLNNFESYNYRFLKNYSTKSKACYYCDKIGHNFAKMYKKYFIDDQISVNTTDTLDLFQENLIYSHEYIFNCKDNPGTAYWQFMIIQVECE